MERNLAKLEEKLWEQFEKAVERQPQLEKYGTYHGNDPVTEGQKAMALIAQSIVAVRTLQNSGP